MPRRRIAPVSRGFVPWTGRILIYIFLDVGESKTEQPNVQNRHFVGVESTCRIRAGSHSCPSTA